MQNQPMNKEELLNRFEEVGGWGEVYDDGSEEFEVYEDDGQLHLNHYGVRLSPEMEVGQGSSRKDFNREVNKFLKDMGYDYKYNEKGLV